MRLGMVPMALAAALLFSPDAQAQSLDQILGQVMNGIWAPTHQKPKPSWILEGRVGEKPVSHRAAEKVAQQAQSPTSAKPTLSQDNRLGLQQGLRILGFYSGPIDGRIGRRPRLRSGTTRSAYPPMRQGL